MVPYDSIFFWPAIVLIGVVVIVISARFLFRVALFCISILIIWYCLFLVGLSPSPIQFFRNHQLFESYSEEAVILDNFGWPHI